MIRDMGASLARVLLGVCAALVVLAAMLCCALVLSFINPASAGDRVAPVVAIPEVSTLYRMKIEREAARNFGLDAPVARLAAQIHQESGWRTNAASPYANGLAQFTPATARWLPSVCPAVGAPDAWDADWSLRAQACYMAWLHNRVVALPGSTLTPCSQWNFALRAYNGGEGWLLKERRASIAAGDDGNAWYEVERHRVRAGWAHRENIGYPRRILLRLEPAYISAGWPGVAAC